MQDNWTGELDRGWAKKLFDMVVMLQEKRGIHYDSQGCITQKKHTNSESTPKTKSKSTVICFADEHIRQMISHKNKDVLFGISAGKDYHQGEIFHTQFKVITQLARADHHALREIKRFAPDTEPSRWRVPFFVADMQKILNKISDAYIEKGHHALWQKSGDVWIPGYHDENDLEDITSDNLQTWYDDCRQLGDSWQDTSGQYAQKQCQLLRKEGIQIATHVITWFDLVERLKADGSFGLYVRLVNCLEHAFHLAYSQQEEIEHINKFVLSYIFSEIALGYLCVFRREFLFGEQENNTPIFHEYPGYFHNELSGITFDILHKHFHWDNYSAKYQCIPTHVNIKVSLEKPKTIAEEYQLERTFRSILAATPNDIPIYDDYRE